MFEFEAKQHEMDWHVLVWQRKEAKRSLVGAIEFKYPLPDRERRAKAYANQENERVNPGTAV